MKKFFLLATFLLLSAFSQDPIPDWVKPIECSLDAPLKPSHIHLQELLFDQQSHFEEETLYLHRIKKVIDDLGIKALSQLHFGYDPSYQKLVFHSLRLYRNGQWSDRLTTSRQEILRQEHQLDAGLFTGRETVVFFLDDVRAGDVIEYALSLIGNHPASRPYQEDLLYLQDIPAVENFHYRILCPSDQPLFIKSFYTSKTPQVREVSPTLLEWTWAAQQTPAFEVEPRIPAWYSPFERVEISQFANWHEVAHHMLPFYSFKKTSDLEMLALVNQWKNTTLCPHKQALLAVRFVQDEVRYLGFEEGIKGCQPSDPNLVFQRRFGDCKDKVVLLQALLQLMDIPSHPVLVHSRAGKALPEKLPGMTVFDHVILKIDIQDSSYFVDATLQWQGGSLAENYYPDYAWGLVLAEETDSLTPLPNPPFLTPTTLSTEIRVISPETAEGSTTIISYGTKAEDKRALLKQLGPQKFSEEFLTLLPQPSTAISSPQFSDDREKNVFSMTFTYQFPTKTRARKKTLPIQSQILNISLDQGPKPQRATPYALVYPVWVKEHIHIENPFTSWEEEADAMSEELPSLVYHSSYQKMGPTADYEFELHHLRDHVLAEEAAAYADFIHRIEFPEPLKIN